MINFYNKLIALSCFVTISLSLVAQTTITYQSTMNPNNLVNNILLGYGVTASNVTFNGAGGSTTQGNAKSFTATNFPFSSGVYIRTSGGTSVASDNDLNALATNAVTNGGKLEFDFVAQGNNLSFDYMFASAEYPTYVCSDYNDVFGFFISGPGITGPYTNGAVNMALIPNTTVPVAINTVNSGTPGGFYSAATCAAQDPNWQANSVYYTTQYATYSGEWYNGGTISMPAGITLQCGETYHIKIAVANVGDDAFDSGVYLKANSFNSDAVQVVVATVTGDTTMYEGCSDANIYFIRPESQTDTTLTIHYTIGGTATNGVDYNNLIDSVTFNIGVDTMIVNISPGADGVSDNNETITITATIVNACGDTLTSTGTLVILDSVDVKLNFTDPTVFCINDSVPVIASAYNGFGPYTYAWSNGDVGDTAYLATVDTTQGSIQYIVTATDACGYTGSDTVTVTVNQTLFIDSILTTPANCQPIGTVSTTTFPYGAHLQNPSNPSSYNLTFDWTYQMDTTINYPNQSALSDLAPGWYVLELTDNVIHCTVKDSAFVNVEDVPVAVITTDPGTGCTPLEVTIGNGSQDANSFQWDLGTGTFGAPTSSTSSFSQTFDVTTTIQLVASNGDVNCNDTTAVTITIVTCGCMDQTATNYNPNAVMDDGSCVFPIPTVEAPNVITLNGDGVNEQFLLSTTNAHSIELIIVNRWGNKVFEGSGAQATPPIWNGKNKAGQEVTEGVYFYKYKVTGVLGEVLEGHGFVTVVK